MNEPFCAGSGSRGDALGVRSSSAPGCNVCWSSTRAAQDRRDDTDVLRIVTRNRGSSAIPEQMGVDRSSECSLGFGLDLMVEGGGHCHLWMPPALQAVLTSSVEMLGLQSSILAAMPAQGIDQ